MFGNWDSLVTLFGKDDGSLPDIELNKLSGEEIVRGYEFVRNHTTHISSKEPYYWSKTNDCEVPIAFEDNPAILVVSGEADSFHVCFGGVHSPSGKSIPELGLFVFPHGLAFDYRMGSQWNREAIEGLFEFIAGMSKDYVAMEIEHQTNINDCNGDIFKFHWEAYKNA